MSAPVSAHAEIDVAADERAVWTVLADIASWPTWNPAVREAALKGEFEVGARFRFATLFGSMNARISEVDAPRTLAWRGRLLTMGEQQSWRLEPGGEGPTSSSTRP